MLDEIVHDVKRWGVWASGQAAKQAVNYGGQSLSWISAGLGTVVTPVVSMIGVGIGAGISAAVAEIDRQKEEAKMVSFYREEVGAILGIPPKAVTAKDLRLAAYGDPERGIEAHDTLKEHLEQLEKRRNVQAGASIIAGVASFAMINLLPAASVMIAGAAMPAVAALGVAVVGGFIVNHVAKAIGSEIFDSDEKTTHEKVVELSRAQRMGKEVSRSQVMDIYISADKEIQQEIEKRHGKPYESLPIARKHLICNELGAQIGLDAVVHDLGHRQVKIQELAFLSQGENSGVPRLPEPPATMLQKMREATVAAGHTIAERTAAIRDRVAQGAQMGVQLSVNGVAPVAITQAVQAGASTVTPNEAIIAAAQQAVGGPIVTAQAIASASAAPNGQDMEAQVRAAAGGLQQGAVAHVSAEPAQEEQNRAFLDRILNTGQNQQQGFGGRPATAGGIGR
jgi:hypothetical protein